MLEANSHKKNILILGASSGIAIAAAKKFASEDWSLSLAARDVEAVKVIVASETFLQANVSGIYHFDALETDAHRSFYESLAIKPDTVLVAFAHNGLHECAEVELDELRRIIDTNYTGVVSIVNAIKPHFIKNRSGAFIIISSVAAERAKSKNYLYGASKAALSYFIEGLQQELKDTGVKVLHVKPGFVKTKMLPDYAPAWLIADADRAATDIYNAYLRKKKFLYTPWFWQWIMLLYRNIPDFIFHRFKQ